MNGGLHTHEIEAAVRTAEQAGLPADQRAEMLVQIAMRVQTQAASAEQLTSSISLYERALALLPEGAALARARVQARRATALQALPSDDTAPLEEARARFAEALPVLEQQGEAAEIAELQMNIGLNLQTLAGLGKARMGDAIRAYQQALKFFTAQQFPQEYAILHNNLATAFLALPTRDPQGRMREALAVQSFEAALAVIRLEEQPLEYAMLQNNLGNALQHVDTTHPAENHLRALDAYDEALRVRTRERSPLQYANTLANRAACCARLASLVNEDATFRADTEHGYREAATVFRACGEEERAGLVEAALAEWQEATPMQPAG